VNLLLDTNVVIWMVGVSQRLSPEVRAMLNDPGNELWVSTSSIHEIAVKVAIGKLRVPANFPQSLEALGCRSLAVTVDDAWRVSVLPLLHRDPFDRLIVAQAIGNSLTLMTSDRELAAYGLPIVMV
jgi:PIN domain nuclease of toxin-antitoxin system